MYVPIFGAAGAVGAPELHPALSHVHKTPYADGVRATIARQKEVAHV